MGDVLHLAIIIICVCVGFYIFAKIMKSIFKAISFILLITLLGAIIFGSLYIIDKKDSTATQLENLSINTTNSSLKIISQPEISKESTLPEFTKTTLKKKALLINPIQNA
ncbi:MAG: hypothetical protein ACQESF_06500 [Nanobdellota archaeon]